MCAAVTTAALSAATAGYQIFQGAKQKRAGQNALNNYERQELENAFEDIPISTLGSDIILEGNNQATANSIDALQNAGSRAIIGGAGRVVNSNNIANQEARAYLDNQIIKRAYETANDDVRIRDTREVRDNSNINALSSQVQAGNQDIFNGIRGLGATANYAANNIDFNGVRTPQESVSQLTPTGLNMNYNNFQPTAPTINNRNQYNPFSGFNNGGF